MNNIEDTKLPSEIIDAHEESVRLARLKGESRDMETAVELMKKAAEGGHSDAQCNLGYLYLTGDTAIAQDPEEGVRWLKTAAERGNLQAQYNLGQVYGGGLGVEADAAVALAYLTKAANAGHPDALYDMGVYHYNGIGGVEKDEKAAFIFFENAASTGHGEACFSMGLCLSLGQGTEKDENRAVACYKKAAEAGNANGMFNLGLYAFYGQGGFEKDLDYAEELFKKAAELGHEKAAHAAASIPEERKKMDGGKEGSDPFADVEL